jgi:hypothetical protein
MDLKEISWEGMIWIGLSQDRDKWMVINFWVPKDAGNFLTNSETIRCSRFCFVELVP